MGLYSPSAGTVYPRLARLESEGLVTHDVEEGRKVYRITDAGRAELAERQGDLDDLEQEIAGSVRDLATEIRSEVRGSVQRPAGRAEGGREGHAPARTAPQARESGRATRPGDDKYRAEVDTAIETLPRRAAREVARQPACTPEGGRRAARPCCHGHWTTCAGVERRPALSRRVRRGIGLERRRAALARAATAARRRRTAARSARRPATRASPAGSSRPATPHRPARASRAASTQVGRGRIPRPRLEVGVAQPAAARGAGLAGSCRSGHDAQADQQHAERVADQASPQSKTRSGPPGSAGTKTLLSCRSSCCSEAGMPIRRQLGAQRRIAVGVRDAAGPLRSGVRPTWSAEQQQLVVVEQVAPAIAGSRSGSQVRHAGGDQLVGMRARGRAAARRTRRGSAPSASRSVCAALRGAQRRAAVGQQQPAAADVERQRVEHVARAHRRATSISGGLVGGAASCWP